MPVLRLALPSGKQQPLLTPTPGKQQDEEGNAGEEGDSPPKPPSADPNAETSLPSWVIRGYHENVFFYTISCLVLLIAYRGTFAAVLPYFGLAGKLVQVVGLVLAKEIVCQIGHGCTIGANLLMLVISIINYE